MDILGCKFTDQLCPEVGFRATDSDSVTDSQQIDNRFSFCYIFKFYCNSVNGNFGQQQNHNRIEVYGKLQNEFWYA